jgi:hypothetical protein
MPLFAHWRHVPVADDAGRGGPLTPSTSRHTSSPPPPTQPPSSSCPSSSSACFCLFDESIENHLQTLHARQRLKGDVQPEIDTYLIACIAPHLRHLVLPHNNVPHYDNLPDISNYALGILDSSMDSDPELQQVLLLLRQCTPLRRRTKRAQREVQWREESLFSMQTLVRTMQGTLLGLYPNCLKAIPFGARVGLLRFLRTLLVQPFEKLHTCMQRIPYIVKLAVMEHLCNTIYDYHPGICHTLNRSGQKVEHFCNSVSTICDIFRGELNTIYCTNASSSSTADGMPHVGLDGARNTAIILDLLPSLEKIAHSYFERCTRAYRGIIIGNVPLPRNIDQARRLCLQLLPPLANGGTGSGSCPATPNPPFSNASTLKVLGGRGGRELSPVAPFLSMEYILSRTWAASNQSLFDAVHAKFFSSQAVRDFAWCITQTIRVYPLPHCVALRQNTALLRRYSGDTTCVARCRILHLCIQCVIRQGSVQVRNTHTPRIRSLLRFLTGWRFRGPACGTIVSRTSWSACIAAKERFWR